MSLPDPVMVEHHGFMVVRDDLLPGGTKRRVIEPMIQASPHREFIYASPAYGYAQLALAMACRALGKHATIFTAKRKQPHPLTLAARKAGAKVVMIPHGYLSHVQSKAKAYAQEVGAQYVPFGVDTDDSLSVIAQAARTLSIEPASVWTVSGSGTLSRGLQRAWPGAEFHSVLIGKQDANVGKAITYRAPESFEKTAKEPPPWPSSAHYDAKLWQFARHHAQPGALIWNVGK